MKTEKTLFIFLILLFSFNNINAQVKSYFGGTLNVFGSSGTSPEYTIQGFFNDTSGEYPLDSVAVGDILYISEGPTCVRLRVDTINSSAGGILDADVYDIDTILLAPPSGIGALMRETPNSSLPRYVPGLSETLLSCIRTHMTGEVDEDIAVLRTDLADTSTAIRADILALQDSLSSPALIFDAPDIQLAACENSRTVYFYVHVLDDSIRVGHDISSLISETGEGWTESSVIEWDGYAVGEYIGVNLAPGAYSPVFEYKGLSTSTVVNVFAGRPDTVTVFDPPGQDSILVTRVCGTEISRDTISAGDILPADNVTGTGTTNNLALWTAASTLGDSYLSQSADALTLASSKVLNLGGIATASLPAATAGDIYYNTTDNRPYWSDGVSRYTFSPWTRNTGYLSTTENRIDLGSGTTSVKLIGSTGRVVMGGVPIIRFLYPTTVDWSDGASVLTNRFYAGGAVRMQQTSTGMYIGSATSPTAKLHLAASAGTASTGPIKFALTGHTQLSIHEAGVLEPNTPGNRLLYTNATPTRKELAYTVEDSLTVERLVSASQPLEIGNSLQVEGNPANAGQYDVYLNQFANVYSDVAEVEPATIYTGNSNGKIAVFGGASGTKGGAIIATSTADAQSNGYFVNTLRFFAGVDLTVDKWGLTDWPTLAGYFRDSSLILSSDTINTDAQFYVDEGDVIFAGTGSTQLHTGTTAQRPGSPVQGEIRANTDNDTFEGYDGTKWRALSTKAYTPTSTADSYGSEGDIVYDDDYIYIKTSAGWKRSALSTF